MIDRPAFPVRNSVSSGAAPVEDLPRWRLDDLYEGLDSPAFAQDLKRAAHECREFAACYRGALAGLLAQPDAPQKLHDAIARYEAIDDLITKIMSFAGLSYAENTVDPVRAKFYGDAQDKITAASTDLLFFQLELNRLDDAALARAIEQAPLSHYRPWIEDLRCEKPFQLEDRIEQLFHEKAVTGHSAWNRLFDETIASLRFEIDGAEMTLEPALNLFQDPDEKTREKASDAVCGDAQGEFAHLRADLQRPGQGQGNLRPMARLPGRRAIAAPVQPRRAGSGGRHGRGGARGLSAPVPSLLQAQGALVRQGAPASLGPQRAAARRPPHDL